MFSLGRLFYGDIPVLKDMGIFGALSLGSLLVLLFLGIGWAYDEKARMWRAKSQVAMERNPYSFVPNYKTQANSYPGDYAVLRTLSRVSAKLGLTISAIDSLNEHLDRYYNLEPERADFRAAQDSARQFRESHPFVDGVGKGKDGVGIQARTMIAFETQILRLTWIQQLSGLFQDILVLGVIYVVFLFPDQAIDGIVPFDLLILGLLFLSIPVFLLVASLGWYYDKKLKIWSVDIAVKVERDPFSYVAEPRLYVMALPFYYTLFHTLRNILDAAGINNQEAAAIMEYMGEYFNLSVTRMQDLNAAQELRKRYGKIFAQLSEET